MFASPYQLDSRDGMLVISVPRLDVPEARTLADLGLDTSSAGSSRQRFWRAGLQALTAAVRGLRAGSGRRERVAATVGAAGR